MAKKKRSNQGKSKEKERLKPLKIDGLTLEEALRGAMSAPPPKDDTGKKQAR